jgi:isopentenyl-diphosphate delta-isomerase
VTTEWLVLVNEEDHEVGTGEKMAVHRAGKLHRAFSVFVTDSAGRILLQRRAATKYHSAGKWSNTCCGHPRPGEPLPVAAHRRLGEEMGFDCPLEEEFSFIYRADLDHDLVEHELDHVFLGSFEGEPRPDPTEVGEWKAVPPSALVEDLRRYPDRYTAWLEPAITGLVEKGLLAVKES